MSTDVTRGVASQRKEQTPPRRRVANRYLALLALATATPVAVVPGRAAAEPCPDVEVVFARGTGEPPGVGQVGQAFTDSLAPGWMGAPSRHTR